MTQTPEGAQRLFLALWPDPEVQAVLGRLAESCVEQCGGRPVAAEKVHLTLVFLGELGPEDVITACEVAARADGEAFTLVVDRLGYWARNRILWAGCEAIPRPLGRLVGALRLGLRERGFGVENRPFQAHLTLARKARRVPRQGMQPIRWPVEDFCLVRSQLEQQGARYEVLRRWSLRAAEAN
jgi:2'-5' RNA ligase